MAVTLGRDLAKCPVHAYLVDLIFWCPSIYSLVSQMATYWFVIAWFDNQSVQKSKVRQAAKDVVKSEVYPQTYSP